MEDITQRFGDFKDPELDQVLVLDPATDFDAVVAVMSGLGLTEDVADASLTRLPGGAPAVTSFSVGGALPQIIYSCNPVVDLQVLDVGTAPPALRARIAKALPLADRATVETWACSTEERRALRGLWAAVETERVDLLRAISERSEDGSGLIATEAARARNRLMAIDSARMSVLGSMGMVREIGMQMTHALADPRVLEDIGVRPKDAADLFAPDIAAAAAELLEGYFEKLGSMRFLPAQSVEDIGAAPAGLLRGYSMITRPFPLGMRDVAGWLKPGVIWLCWTGRDPRHGTMRFDGLAFTGERWVFCPRPYRIVAQALPEDVRHLWQPQG